MARFTARLHPHHHEETASDSSEQVRIAAHALWVHADIIDQYVNMRYHRAGTCVPS